MDSIDELKECFDMSGAFDIFNFSSLNLSDIFLSTTNTSDHRNNAFLAVLTWMNVYVTPVIIAFGVVGNTLSLLVFSLTHLKRLSSSLYLSALALADLGFLCALTIVWLERVEVSIFTTDGWCPSVIYVTKVCGFVAVWNVVSFTSERYVIVYYPLQKDTLCAKRIAVIVVAVLCVISSLLYVYVFFTYDVIRFGAKVACSPLPAHYDVITVMSSVETVMACAVPSIIIVVLNVRIIIKIHQFHERKGRAFVILIQDQRRSGIHTSISNTGSMHIKFTAKQDDERHPVGGPSCDRTLVGSSRMLRSRSQFRTARMLLVLSSVIVLLNLPSHIFQVLAFLRHLFGGSAKQSKQQRAWQEVFQLVYFMNFAISFFIYSACGYQFRMGLKRLCRRWLHKAERSRQMVTYCRNKRDKHRIDRGMVEMHDERFQNQKLTVMK
jgi:thyrotropin-releasing hormone receptor